MSSRSEHDFLDDGLRCHRVLAADRGGQTVVAVDPVDDVQHAFDGGDVDFAFVHRIEPRHVGERVEIDCADVAVSADLPQQFDGLQRMHGADHQPIVALGVAVVEMHAEQLAMTRHQSGGKGRLLVGIEHMGEVERDAEIGQADIADRQQCRRRIRHQAVGAGLIGLVFQADLAIRIMRGDFTNSFDLVSHIAA